MSQSPTTVRLAGGQLSPVRFGFASSPPGGGAYVPTTSSSSALASSSPRGVWMCANCRTRNVVKLACCAVCDCVNPALLSDAQAAASPTVLAASHQHSQHQQHVSPWMSGTADTPAGAVRDDVAAAHHRYDRHQHHYQLHKELRTPPVYVPRRSPSPPSTAVLASSAPGFGGVRNGNGSPAASSSPSSASMSLRSLAGSTVDELKAQLAHALTSHRGLMREFAALSQQHEATAAHASSLRADVLLLSAQLRDTTAALDATRQELHVERGIRAALEATAHVTMLPTQHIVTTEPESASPLKSARNGDDGTAARHEGEIASPSNDDVIVLQVQNAILRRLEPARDAAIRERDEARVELEALRRRLAASSSSSSSSSELRVAPEQQRDDEKQQSLVLKVEQLTSSVADLEAARDALRSALDDAAEDEDDRVHSALEPLRDELDETKAALLAAILERDSARKECESLRRQVQQQQKPQDDESTSSSSSSSDDSDDLAERLSEILTERDALQAEVAALKTAAEEAEANSRRSREDWHQRVEALHRALAEQQLEQSKLVEQNDALTVALQDMEQTLADALVAAAAAAPAGGMQSLPDS